MKMMLTERLHDFLEDESGNELAEYAIVLTFFAFLMIVGLNVLSGTANNNLSNTENSYSTYGLQPPT